MRARDRVFSGKDNLLLFFVDQTSNENFEIFLSFEFFIFDEKKRNN